MTPQQEVQIVQAMQEIVNQLSYISKYIDTANKHLERMAKGATPAPSRKG